MAVGCFALGAWLLLLPLGLVDPTHLPGCACEDQALQVWLLAANHWAVIHGHLPLSSTRIDFPTGVNLLDNTGMPLLGVLATPLISVVGPVGAFDFLLRVGFLCSATSCFFVLRRYVRSDFAAFSGAALYAFGPFLAHQGESHLNLVFLPIPPLLFVLVQQRVISGRRDPAAGVAIALLAVAQYFISSEVLLGFVVVMGLTLALRGAGGMLRGHRIGPQVRAATSTLAVAGGVALLLLAYPTWYALDGPRHLSGASQPEQAGTDLANLFVPVTRQVVTGRWLGALSSGPVAAGSMTFVGVPLTIAVVAVAVILRRAAVVRLATVFGLVSVVLALGPGLIVDGTRSVAPMPFAVLVHLPLLRDLIPARLMLFADLAAAVLLAVGVDALLGRSGPALRRWTAGLALALVGAGSVLPAHAYPVAATKVAAGFLHGRMGRAIPPGAVVLTYPYPTPTSAQAMIWQADAGLGWSMLGGYALHGDAPTALDRLPPPLEPRAVTALLQQCWQGRGRGVGAISVAQAERALPSFVRRYHVTAIVVDRTGHDPAAVVAAVQAVYGPPTHIGAMSLWTDLHPERERLVASARGQAAVRDR